MLSDPWCSVSVGAVSHTDEMTIELIVDFALTLVHHYLRYFEYNRALTALGDT